MRSILLLPHDDHRDALLAPGLCGGRVPMLHRVLDAPPRKREWRLCGSVMNKDPSIQYALVLAWKGQPAPLGIARVLFYAHLNAEHLEAYVCNVVDGDTATKLQAYVGGLGTIEVIDHDA